MKNVFLGESRGQDFCFNISTSMPTFDIEDDILKLRDSVSNVDRRAPYWRLLAVGGHALHGVAQLNRIGRRASWSDVYTHGHFHLFDRRFFKLFGVSVRLPWYHFSLGFSVARHFLYT